MLIGARALQGLGAAFISPAALAIISTTFKEGSDRAKALGVWAAIAIGGSAIGLVLGGALTQAFSWPWIFFINVPVGIAVFFLSTQLVPESKDETAHRSFDVPGAITVTGGLMTLVYAIVQTEQKGWGSTTTIVTFVIAVALLVGFVLIELRAKAPLVRLSIFRVRSLSAANVVMFLVVSGLFAMFFFNSLYIQRVLGYGPLKAGLAFLPFTAGIMVSAGLASAFGPKVGVRLTSAIGMVVAAAGLLLLTRIPVDGSYAVDVSAVAPAHVARHGRRVRLAHARRDDRPRGRRPGSRVGPLQHVAADRRCARARDPLDDRREPTRATSSTRSSCDGFHWAFAGSAVFVLAGLVALVAMLRQRDVAQIEQQVEDGGGGDRRGMTLRADAQRNLDRLLEAAAECFAEQGVDASVDEIARRAGVGHGTVFRRFPTKDALLAAVLATQMLQLSTDGRRRVRRAGRGRGVRPLRPQRRRRVRAQPRADRGDEALRGDAGGRRRSLTCGRPAARSVRRLPAPCARTSPRRTCSRSSRRRAPIPRSCSTGCGRRA